MSDHLDPIPATARLLEGWCGPVTVHVSWANHSVEDAWDSRREETWTHGPLLKGLDSILLNPNRPEVEDRLRRVVEEEWPHPSLCDAVPSLYDTSEWHVVPLKWVVSAALTLPAEVKRG